jgi:predicted regulator of Ras-like GTPase activity (Roadblock/LC7/MglB family)
MRDLQQVARVPGVKSAVLADARGTFLDAVREPDGEAAAAVAGFLATSLGQVGEPLGLGALRRAVLQGAARATLLLVQDGGVVAATVEPAGALAGVEKALEATGARER